MAGFPSLDDLKAHLNITDSDNDSELLLMLDAASEVVESFVGSYDPNAITEQVTVRNGTAVLSGIPAGDVILTYPDSTSVTGFTVYAAAGLLQNVPTYWGQLTASYTAGDGNVPAAVGLATLIIAAHLWETQRGVSPSALALQQTDESFGVTAGAGFAIPNRAKELLAPFVRSAGVS